MQDSDYNVVLGSRTPQQSTSPILAEIAELEPVGAISFADEVNSEGEASFSLEPEKIPDDAATRMKDLKATPCEIFIYREGSLAWAGPLLSCQVQGPTLTVNARGLLYYCRYMTLEADLIYSAATDQWTIGKGLVDAYQALDYGNYGIDTSTIGTSGITRTRRYPYVENQNVFRRLIQLAEVDNGFDVWVDPTDRKLKFSASKGSDKTQSVFADETNIVNNSTFWSIAEDDIASDSIAVGTSDADDQLNVVGTALNSGMRSTFGRVTRFQTVDDVSTQTTIDDYAQRMIDQRTEQNLVPGPSVVPITDVDPSTIETGDLVTYALAIGTLGTITTQRRIRLVRTTADEAGVETMQVELI